MDLHRKFVQLGTQRKNLTRQLQALLPEIYKQEIYKKHGYGSIFEYAWRFAGFSKTLTEKIIQVGKHLEDKPFLKGVIASQGIHKVALVSTIATPENDKVFAEHVKNMSKAALFQFSKELRHHGSLGNQHELGLATGGVKCQAVPEKIKIELDDETQTLFLQLKKKLKKEFRREFSHKEALKIILEKLTKNRNWLKKEANAKEKDKSSKKQMPDQISIPGNGTGAKSTQNEEAHEGVEIRVEEKVFKRYIPAHQKRKILSQTKHKCAYPNCNKPYEILHHRERFANNKSHESIIPLCKEHHEFAHNGLIKNEIGKPKDWQLGIAPKTNFVDELFLKYRIQN